MPSQSVVVVLAGSLLAVSLGGCASFPLPTQRLAEAESGARAATELGAAKEPSAALHLKMANDQVAEARKLLDVDNERADALLLRARADAELSLQLTKEAQARKEADAMMSKVGGVQPSAANPGAH